MNEIEIIEVGKALLPYLRNDLTSVELGTAAHDAVAALNRVRASQPPILPTSQSSWQPIETALRDGTEYLVGHTAGWRALAAFVPAEMAWIETAASGRKIHEPTHFMPLPAPPLTKDA